MARQSRKAMADVRALEEQSERMNPVAKRGVPTQGVSEVRGGAMPLLGQTRKGRGMLKITHGGAEAESPRSRSPSPDAKTMGGMLYHQLSGLKGAGWCDEFRSAFVGGAKPTGEPALGNPDVMDTEGFSANLTGGNLSQSGRYEGQGMARVVGAGKRKRAPAGPEDGRRKRAEVVRKVMAEKGLSMIEASKHVKAHGLY